MWKNSQSGISEEASNSKPCYIDGNERSMMKEEKLNQDGKKQETKEQKPSSDFDRIFMDSELSISEVPVVKKYASTYELEKYKKNTMIMFNHKDFLGGQNTRLGTMQDEEALKTTFEMFNFEVESHLNLDKKTLFQELKKFCSKDFREYGCVCIAVLTHGSKHGYLKARDTRYSEHEIIECFDVQNNRTLFGKPIIILIQACRGGEPATACHPETPKSEGIELDSADDHYNLPTESNMVIFHSSYVGRASARDVLKGSWFIQTLCEQIKLLAAVEDFESICRAVRQQVALDKQYKVTVNNKPVIVKQMPVLTSTLLRLLYLRKYEGNIEDDLNKEEQFVKGNKDIKIGAENAQEKIRLCSNISRVQDTNLMFQQLHEAIKWCKDKLNKLHNPQYGSDLPGVQRELDMHQWEHKQITQFRLKMNQCVDNKAGFSGEELALYSQHLSILQKLYFEMQLTSSKRMSDLESLQDFLQSAMAELKWLSEKEQMQLSQEWANSKPSINNIWNNPYFTTNRADLSIAVHWSKRELQFINVTGHGEVLIAQHHPAAKTIEAHLQTMKSQWDRLQQLHLCLETHLEHFAQYRNFFQEVQESQEWIQKRKEVLNSTFSQSEVTLDQGQRLLKGMEELREELNSHGAVVSRLVERAKIIRPATKRWTRVTTPLRAETVCTYKQDNVAIEKGSALMAVDDSGRSHWLVRLGGAGTEAQLPGNVALRPPSTEAQDAAAVLSNAYDKVIQLWKRKQLRTRQNIMFATIIVVKGWDLSQFVAMGPEQRQVIKQTLNEDFKKLLAEGDPADPHLQRMRKEIDAVNQQFAAAESRAPSAIGDT